jgi:ketosteroid isomerase-like protein
MRQMILLPVLIMVLVGCVKAQGNSENQSHAVVEAGTRQELINEVKSFINQIEDAKKRSDMAALERYYADDFICKDERFGGGEVLHKIQFLERRTTATHGPEDQVIDNLVHSKVEWVVVGNTVIRSGYSRTILKDRGRLSKGPRLFSFVYVKNNGQWQIAAEDVFDIPSGYEEPEKAQCPPPWCKELKH